jgi:anaphase-promoting complex subunit 10
VELSTKTPDMPPSLRNRTQALDQDDTDSEVELSFTGHRARPHDMQEEEDDDEEEDDLVGEEDEDDEAPGAPQTPLPNLDPPPSYLREISTLASWTVSSSKPGCSIPQLRHPSTSLFWQSDGPQPHYLNIHFFKLVRIVGLRLYLDFEQDESYTPTRIIFLAGSGMNDLQEWGEMKSESPRGWIWADFSNVGDPDDDGDDDEDEEGDTRMNDRIPLPIENVGPNGHGNDASSDSENNNPQHRIQQTPQQHQTPQIAYGQTPQNGYTHNQTPQYHQTPQTGYAHTPVYTSPAPTQSISRPHPRQPFTSLSTNPTVPPSPRRPRMPVLRAHLVQIKILENHQNGKDTHLRGLQIFARNDEKDAVAKGARRAGVGGDEVVLGKKGKKVDLDLESLELGGLDDDLGIR